MDMKDLQAGMQSDHFWLVAKREMIDLLMQKAVHQSTNLKILNIGAGTGEDFAILRSYGTLVVIDIDPQAVALMPDNLVEEKLVADACALPFTDEYFDCIVAFDVLEHIPNDALAVREIYRCLKPGGKLVFSVPAFNFLFSEHDDVLGHCRRYDKKMLRSLFKQFDQQVLLFWFFLLFIPAAAVRILQKLKILPLSHSGGTGLFNKLFHSVMRIENWLLKKQIPLPWGLSLVGIMRKS